jgi:F0F1-type ATP synthase membrane subunit a
MWNKFLFISCLEKDLQIVLAIFISGGVFAISQGVNGAELTFKPLNDADNFSLGLVMGHHISVIVYFIKKKKSKNYFKHLVLPLVGFIIIAYVWWNLDALSKQLGFAWLAIGIIYLLFLKFTKRDTKLNLEE